MLDYLISRRGVRDWMSRNNPDWRPQFAAMVQRRVKMFEDAAENASAEG
jgi:hypothetical protein